MASLPGISGIPVQEVQEISETIALQPRQRGLQLRQGHGGPALVAQHAFEHGVEPDRVFRRLLILEGWSHDQAYSPVFS